jgi:glucose-1-phosphate thymidylyltransferase
VRIACLEEVALRMGFISADACYALGAKLATSSYGHYVMDAARRHEHPSLMGAPIRVW